MAWSAPMTAVANAQLTATEYNTNIRDNLLETEPAISSATGSLFVCDGLNSIVERRAEIATVDTSQTTTSTSFTDLATAGPSVTVTTGTRAICFFQAYYTNNNASMSSYASPAVSGATTIAADDSYSIRRQGTNNQQHAGLHTFLDLTAGSNTFTMKYRVAGGTGTWVNRRIIVWPF